MSKKKDLKYDQGKIRMDLLPMECLEKMAEVLTFGASKYKENSWQTVKNNYERYRGSLLRHMVAMQKGERIDDESGLFHAAHLACNAMFILWFEINRQEKQEDESNRHTLPRREGNYD